VGYECAEKGNKMISCPNRDKWAYAEQKVKSEGHLTSTRAIDSELYLLWIAPLPTTKCDVGVSSMDLWRTLDSDRIKGRTFGFGLFQIV
jgi:hypothetical protein